MASQRRSFDEHRNRSQSPIRQIEQEQNARLEATLHEVLSSTPALSHAAIVTNPHIDTAEKLFRSLDQDRDGLLKKPDMFTFASATGFDPAEGNWDETYGELCAEYGLAEDEGLDLEHFRGLCNAYLAHDCYETAINDLIVDLEGKTGAAAPGTGRSGSQRAARSRGNSELENFTLGAPAGQQAATSSSSPKRARGSGATASPHTGKKESPQQKPEESKEVRKLRKKVREVEEIEKKIQSGKKVEALQREKVNQKEQLLQELQKQLFADAQPRPAAAALVEAGSQSPSHKFVERRRRDSSLVQTHDTAEARQASPAAARRRKSLSGTAEEFVPAESKGTMDADWRGQMGTGNYEEDQEVAQYNRMLADAWRSGGYGALQTCGYAAGSQQGGMPLWYGNNNYASQYGYGADNQYWQQQKEAFQRRNAGDAAASGDASPTGVLEANFAGGNVKKLRASR